MATVVSPRPGVAGSGATASTRGQRKGMILAAIGVAYLVGGYSGQLVAGARLSSAGWDI